MSLGKVIWMQKHYICVPTDATSSALCSYLGSLRRLVPPAVGAAEAANAPGAFVVRQQMQEASGSCLQQTLPRGEASEQGSKLGINQQRSAPAPDSSGLLGASDASASPAQQLGPDQDRAESDGSGQFTPAQQAAALMVVLKRAMRDGKDAALQARLTLIANNNATAHLLMLLPDDEPLPTMQRLQRDAFPLPEKSLGFSVDWGTVAMGCVAWCANACSCHLR